jgi:predicted metal-dependent peptidase
MQDLGSVTRDLLFEEPFWGFFLITLNKNITKSVPTAGVSRRGMNFELAINPDFWDTQTDEHKKGILVHECLHISMHHISMRDSYKDWSLFNIAADLEINQYIKQEWIDKEHWITLDKFAHLNFPKKMGTEWYYDNLLKNSQDPTVQMAVACAQEGHGDPQEGEGEPDPNNPFNSSGVDHSTWKEFQDLDDATKKLIGKQIDYQLKETFEKANRQPGNIPGSLKQYLDDLYKKEPAKFDWKGYFRRFVGNSTMTNKRKSRRKLSKRFSGNPGLKVLKRRHILVGIDTSGSVSDKDLKEFFTEIYHMHKSGNKITIAQCDTRIHDVSPYDPKKKMKIHGRGGTSFEPVCELFEKSKEYTCLVYLTDGYASAPQMSALSKVLWVHCSAGDYINEDLPGFKIKLS